MGFLGKLAGGLAGAAKGVAGGAGAAGGAGTSVSSAPTVSTPGAVAGGRGPLRKLGGKMMAGRSMRGGRR